MFIYKNIFAKKGVNVSENTYLFLLMKFNVCNILLDNNVNFHLQKCSEIFDKNSADKIWSKKDKEKKVSPPMLIRVKDDPYPYRSRQKFK